MKLLLSLLAGFLVFLPMGWAQDWEVVWKDDMQELRLDRDSVKVNGSEVEYWYSDEVDAFLDIMEHHSHVVSDCANHRIRLLEIYDPDSGQTRSVPDPRWRELPYDPKDAVTVMHYGVCRNYAK